MTIHAKLQCRRCQREPQHIDVIQHLDTGINVVETVCLDCGWAYRWRATSDFPSRVLLCDERPISPIRLKYLRRKRGV